MRSLLQLLALLPVALTLATSPLLKAPEPRALSAPRNNVQLQREGVKNDAARPALAKRSPREGPWANYRHLRIRDGTVPPAKYSPLPVINGDTIEKSIQTQIKVRCWLRLFQSRAVRGGLELTRPCCNYARQSDVNAVLQEFKSLPDYVNNLLKTALSRTLNQVNLKQTPEEQRGCRVLTPSVCARAAADSAVPELSQCASSRCHLEIRRRCHREDREVSQQILLACL